MSKAYNIVKDITIDFLHATTYFLTSNMRGFANTLSVSCPYVMYFIGQYIQTGDFKFVYSYYLAIPITVVLITYYLHSAANKTGKGNSCPVPIRRFTTVSEDGEVSIEHARLQEMLLYMADLEDWMERKNIL